MGDVWLMYECWDVVGRRLNGKRVFMGVVKRAHLGVWLGCGWASWRMFMGCGWAAVCGPHLGVGHVLRRGHAEGAEGRVHVDDVPVPRDPAHGPLELDPPEQDLPEFRDAPVVLTHAASLAAVAMILGAMRKKHDHRTSAGSSGAPWLLAEISEGEKLKRSPSAPPSVAAFAASSLIYAGALNQERLAAIHDTNTYYPLRMHRSLDIFEIQSPRSSIEEHRKG